MKRLNIILLFFFLMYTTEVLNAQHLQIGMHSGLSKISFNDSFTQDISNVGLSLDNGFHFGLIIKYSIPSSPLKFVGNISYIFINGEGYFSDILYLASSSYEKIKLNTTSNITSFGIGLEYYLTKKSISPYLIADFLVNSYSNVTLERSPNYNVHFLSKFLEYNTIPRISNKTRYGLGLGTGIEFSFFKKLSLNIFTKYNFMNLLNKKENYQANGINYKEEGYKLFTIVGSLIYCIN